MLLKENTFWVLKERIFLGKPSRNVNSAVLLDSSFKLSAWIPERFSCRGAVVNELMDVIVLSLT